MVRKITVRGARWRVGAAALWAASYVATLGCGYPDVTFDGDASLPSTDGELEVALGDSAVGTDGADGASPDGTVTDDARVDTLTGDADSGGVAADSSLGETKPDGCPKINSCGGCAILAGSPGDACSAACGGGTLVCKGIDALECKPTTSANACGGCATLSASPGAACSAACGTGTYTCSGVDAVACTGGPAKNACGGCAKLSGAPTDPCIAPCGAGKLVCSGLDALVCAGPGKNLCGGCATLSATPGDACGGCGDGLIKCEGTDAVKCYGGHVPPCP